MRPKKVETSSTFPPRKKSQTNQITQNMSCDNNSLQFYTSCLFASMFLNLARSLVKIKKRFFAAKKVA